VSARKRLVIYDAAGVEASRERFGYSVSAPNPGPPYRVAPRLRPVLRRPPPRRAAFRLAPDMRPALSG